jgi:hypothetical protein
VLTALALVVVACDSGETELSTSSTIITGGTNAPETTSTTGGGDGSGTSSPPTSLAGQSVTGFDVAETFPNDNGVEKHYVIPNGAYTDVDLENFMIDLIESDSELYGAEVFDNADAAAAFLVDPGARTEEHNALLERHHFVTLVGRDSVQFNGPFAEFAGGAIGS